MKWRQKHIQLKKNNKIESSGFHFYLRTRFYLSTGIFRNIFKCLMANFVKYGQITEKESRIYWPKCSIFDLKNTKNASLFEIKCTDYSQS